MIMSGLWVVYEILVTAQRPNSTFFPFLDLSGTGTWPCQYILYFLGAQLDTSSTSPRQESPLFWGDGLSQDRVRERRPCSQI